MNAPTNPVGIRAHTDAAFAHRAEGIGGLLVDSAIWHGDCCNWTGDTVADDVGTVEHRALTGDLYAGTAGVSWFLAHLARAFDDEAACRAALGAARHAITWTDGSGDVGLYTGRCGVAVAVAAVANLLDERSLRRAAVDLADDLARHVVDDGPDPGWDLVAGDAGVAVGLVALARLLDHGPCIAAATQVADRLVRRSSPMPVGVAWQSTASEVPLCGIAHGASGVALALREVASLTAIGRWDETILEARRFERAHFDSARRNWPDLRSVPPVPVQQRSTIPYPTFWCHGAVGVGLARLRDHQVTGDLVALTEAAAALDVATTSVLRSTACDPGGTDATLCHGAGGTAELHLFAAEVTGDSEHLEHARHLIERAWPTGDPRAARCGIPAGGRAPGLMVGLAGTGAVSLRASGYTSMPSPLGVASLVP